MLEKSGRLKTTTDFQSTADLLTILSDRSSGATQAIALGISKPFDRVGYVGLLHKLRSMVFRERYLALLCLFSVIHNFGWL